jgi:hypothetical protein
MKPGKQMLMRTILVAIFWMLVLGGCSRSVSQKAPAAESIKGQLITLSELVDAGDATPEAAWESRYWARAHGDYDAVIAATAPEMVDAARSWMGDKAAFRSRSQSEFDSFTGIQILARKAITKDKVELKYAFGFGARQQTKIVEMIQIGTAWKSGATRPYDASWDEGSEFEPQP